MRAIVFGSTGFIGSHVTEQLIFAGHHVIAAVRDNSDTAFLQNIHAKIKGIDFDNSSQITEAISGNDIVYCCLANPKQHQSIGALREIEVKLTENIFISACTAGAKRFVLLSTVMVYGFSRPPIAINENHPPEPTFDFNKVAFERENTLAKLAIKNNIELVILRPTNTIGKRDIKMGQLFKSYRQGFYPVFGRKEFQFSGIDTRDIGRAMVFLGELPEAKNNVYLVKGFDTSWLDMKRTLDKITGKNTRIIKMPVWLMKVIAHLMEIIIPYHYELQLSRFAISVMSTNTLFDDNRIRQAGFKPNYSLEDALIDYLEN